jgi:hypothetical protein
MKRIRNRNFSNTFSSVILGVQLYSLQLHSNILFSSLCSSIRIRHCICRWNLLINFVCGLLKTYVLYLDLAACPGVAQVSLKFPVSLIFDSWSIVTELSSFSPATMLKDTGSCHWHRKPVYNAIWSWPVLCFDMVSCLRISAGTVVVW